MPQPDPFHTECSPEDLNTVAPRCHSSWDSELHLQGKAPIGIFDSGYGGLTILNKIRALMPQYDYLYLGDNARAPYGSRSYEIVYRFTWQAVSRLFDFGCPLIILACNTASAKALRTIQQHNLPHTADPTRRVLGIIRPTVEALDGLSHTKHVGVLATEGTVISRSYEIEIAKLHPHITVTQEACPMWVPLVENGEANSPGAEYFVQKHLNALYQKDSLTDTVLLGCTHYPLLRQKIEQYLPAPMQVVSQGDYVAHSLKDYLLRHPEMEKRLSQAGTTDYLTTENASKFSHKASVFLQYPITAQHITIDC